MRYHTVFRCCLALLSTPPIRAWSPPQSRPLSVSKPVATTPVALRRSQPPSSSLDPPSVLVPLLPLSVLLLPSEALAASPSPVASAFAAYGHFASLLAIVGALVAERLTVKPNMTDAEEDRLAAADITLGVAGALLAYTGYLRVVSYGKGWEFYAHEPVFWLKIVFVAVFGAVSFFPTTKIVQRSLDKRNGKLVPMSEKLAGRMTSLINAELLMVGSIPLTASLMARGVGYWEDFPWPLGAAAAAAALLGLGYKYVNEALTWSEEE